ncbi:hypothetical protein L3X40_07050 [Rhizorhapis sp. SPR117]|nr:hypothetical protein [Rhizorhapis sp. SPR117]
MRNILVGMAIAAFMAAAPAAALAHEGHDGAQCEPMKDGKMKCCEKDMDGKTICRMMDKQQQGAGHTDHSRMDHSRMNQNGERQQHQGDQPN